MEIELGEGKGENKKSWEKGRGKLFQKQTRKNVKVWEGTGF